MVICLPPVAVFFSYVVRSRLQCLSAKQHPHYCKRSWHIHNYCIWLLVDIRAKWYEVMFGLMVIWLIGSIILVIWNVAHAALVTGNSFLGVNYAASLIISAGVMNYQKRIIRSWHHNRFTEFI